MLSSIRKTFYMLLLLCPLAACESFLDEKPDKQQVVPTTLADLQALLDDYSVVNNNDTGEPEISADDYFLTDADWASLTRDEHRRLYTWENDPAIGANDWLYTYRTVYTANTVLERLARIPRTGVNQAQYDHVKGQAHFIRAKSFLQAALSWAQAYEAGTAASTPGIPLRLSTEFSEKSTRASLQETFDQVITDLETSTALLPPAPLHPVRPAQAAAHALLARTYLYMRLYPQVETHATASLQLYSFLQNFNELNTGAAFPFGNDSKEIVYWSMISVPTPLSQNRAKINPELLASYATDDLRKDAYFRANGDGTYSFKGSYVGGINLFSGVATDEVYLIRAEARARQGKVNEALQDLNTLLSTRWRAGTFVPFEAGSEEEAVALILRERRKELLMRGLRWMDLKRLNLEGAAITLTRTVNGQTYTLPPNDPRYALPIPEEVIALSGMQQNPR